MPPNAFPAVIPIVDYEPPTIGGPPALPPVVPIEPVRPSPGRRPQRSAGEDRTRAAATFADAALRRVLEVIDRRRPLAQLRSLMATGLADSLLTAVPGGPPAARLRRVLAQSVGPGDTAAEVSASYLRGDRVHAIACRVEQVPTVTGRRWQIVALHLG